MSTHVHVENKQCDESILTMTIRKHSDEIVTDTLGHAIGARTDVIAARVTAVAVAAAAAAAAAAAGAEGDLLVLA